MTGEPGGKRVVPVRLVAELEAHGLTVERLKAELLIVNPGAPERGRVHLEYQDGFVSRERVCWDYLGTLDGLGPGDDSSPGVTIASILDLLGVRSSAGRY